MPQLDTLTYFSQFFWLILIFFSFYILLSNKIIPQIGILLKLRKELGTPKVKIVNQGGNNLNNEKILIQNFSDLKKLNNEIDINSKIWLNNGILDINKKNLESMNQEYINTLANFLIKKNLFGG